MNDLTAMFATLRAEGASVESALHQLRLVGASPIEAIKAIMGSERIGLGEAKRIFSESPSWLEEVKAADQLHEEIIDLLKDDLF